MAKKSSNTNTSQVLKKPKVKRPNVHSKKKTSNHKSSKNYKKKYVGQGR